MYLMASSAMKPLVTRAITPVAKFFLLIGLTPNAVTALGALFSVVTTFILIPTGHFFAASIIVSIFMLSDLFDGTMARISSKGPSKWGAFLDSTLDRISDSALLVATAIYLANNHDRLAWVAASAVVFGILVPYTRSKAEGLNIECNKGFAERTERLIIALIAIGFHGLGAPYVLAIGFWFLALISAATTFQRLLIVKRA